MEINNNILNWLLEDNNPGVSVRTLTELCGFSENHKKVKAARQLVVSSLEAAKDLSWMALKGQIIVYNLTALAESGLTRKDIKIDSVVDKILSMPFDIGCGDLMALRAMVMLGYGNNPKVKKCLAQMKSDQLPDGGWLCLHRVRKMKKIPKSCIRAAIHGLLCISELKKRGVIYDGTEELTAYFLKRRLFYRMDNPKQLVLNRRPGRRMTDVFFPSEYFHIGLPLLLDSLVTLGVGKSLELQKAWDLLDEKKDAQGKILLEGTLPLSKSYLQKERVGKPSKWGTFYAYSAWKNNL